MKAKPAQPARAAMRAILAVLVLSLALAPLAAADQSITAGPARAETINGTWGDGCGGPNGGDTRTIVVNVDDPRGGGSTTAVADWSCARYDFGAGDYHFRTFSVYASNTQFNTPGPSAYYSWYGGTTPSYSFCGSHVGTGATYVSLGCPAPDGSAPPMIPALP